MNDVSFDIPRDNHKLFLRNIASEVLAVFMGFVAGLKESLMRQPSYVEVSIIMLVKLDAFIKIIQSCVTDNERGIAGDLCQTLLHDTFVHALPKSVT